MSSFSTGHNEVNLARRANIRRVNRVSNAGRAVICPHPFASIHVRRGIEATGGGRKKTQSYRRKGPPSQRRKIATRSATIGRVK